MNSISCDLKQATADLALVVNEGLLSDLKASIAYSLRGQPRDDYAPYPGLKHNVEEFAGLLQSFTGLPWQLCRLAALDQLLPNNRNRQSLEVLHQFAEDIRSQQARDRGTRLLRRRTAS